MTVADEEDDHTDEPALISTSSGVPLWKQERGFNK